VTDPNTTDSRARQYLPNPVLHMTVDDLSGAIRAESVGRDVGWTRWHRHKRVRFNGNAWINIPELGASSGIPPDTTASAT